MRLISCYIENFGGLQKFSYDFNEGLNIILEENGWGKSTLAAFLKAMFYGLERTTKRSLDENERKKYEPWNGGTYGGNLIFEADGCEYRVERFFGIKDKEDSFALYDVRTGLESDVYTERIGEELFGIDRGAFEQSIFMRQGMYAVTMTDSVTTKMSGLMAGGDDVDCYEKACARLDSEMKIYKKIGNKGRIPELTEEIAVLSRKIAEGKQIGASIAEWEGKKNQCTQELEAILKQKEVLRQQMLKAGEQAAFREKRKFYNTLMEEKEKLECSVEGLDKYFQNGVPTEEDLEQYRNKLFLYKREDDISISEQQSFRYPEMADVLKTVPMTEEELDACEQKWNAVREKENCLEKKKLQLQGMIIREEEKNGYLKDKQKSIGIKQNVLLVLAALALLAAIVLYFIVGNLPALISAVIALICPGVAVGCFIKKKQLMSAMNESNEELLQAEEECNELTQNIAHMKRAVCVYLQAFSVVSEEDIPACIGKIRITLMEIKASAEREVKQQLQKKKNAEEKEALRDELILFLRRFYPDTDTVEEYLLKEIGQKRNEYISISKQYEEKCRQIDQADKVENVPEEEILSMDKLQQEELVLEQSILARESYLRQINQTISQYRDVLEECEKAEMEKNDLEELLSEYTAKYKLLEKTLKYLKTAQSEFSSRYLKKINEGFALYAELFRENAFNRSSLDVKLAVKSDEAGVKRDIGYYSVGLRETMELCTRFALIEALFEQEQPFVVLDDPFVNLDEKSLAGAKEVLAQIAKKYQLIYFTCHPSRQ